MLRARHLGFVLLLSAAACDDGSGSPSGDISNVGASGGAAGGVNAQGTGGNVNGSTGISGNSTGGNNGFVAGNSNGVVGGSNTGASNGFVGNNAGTGGNVNGSNTGSPGVGDASGLPCDVKKIVYEKCGACHSDPPVGTFMPLLTNAHFQALSTTPGNEGQSYAALARTRINSADRPMPPQGSTPLTEAERATLNAWLDQGAPVGTDSCGGGDVISQPGNGGTNGGGNSGNGEEIDTTGLQCVKLLAHANNDKNRKYKVGAVVDGYVNVNHQSPWRQTVYGVVIRPVIDNAKVLHHWLLYREPGGQDGRVTPSGGQHTGGELIHGWAPGGESLNFRKYDDVGVELPVSNYVVEFHYNSNDPNAEDASGVEVCYRTDKPRNIAGLSWVGFDQGVESYAAGAILGGWASGFCLDPRETWVGTCRPKAPQQPIHIVGVSPHMHESGLHMKAVIKGPNGERVLHDAPFAFDSQVHYDVEETLMPGEYIETTCNFSAKKCAGQATGSEMCYLFTYAYPKGALSDNGLWGQIAHGQNACLGQ